MGDSHLIAVVHSAVIVGVDARLVEVQVDVSRGLPYLEIVGLPGASVRESRQRVRSALRSAGLDFPLARITVNLAPAGLRKEGSSFDLPIALGIAMASSQIPPVADEVLIAIGELGLDASIRPVNGILSIAELARELGRCRLVIPAGNYEEANVIPELHVVSATHLSELIERLRTFDAIRTTGRRRPRGADDQRSAAASRAIGESGGSLQSGAPVQARDLKHVVGLEMARRSLEIAAAGEHSLLMVGPPGSGKSMLASCMPGILPPLTLPEAIEVTKIHSIAGIVDRSCPLLEQRPFRTPHHSITLAGLIGGGRPVRPGELSLAHNGVLYLDELGEFRREAIDALREPLDTGRIVLNKHLFTVSYPCQVLLVASMNPCPCGYHGSRERECICTDRQIREYRSVLSGPFLDRLDMTINIMPVSSDQLVQGVVEGTAEASDAVRARVCRARELQMARFCKADTQIRVNSRMAPEDIRTYCRVTLEAERILVTGGRRLALTGRGMTRSLRVARTIADMEGELDILARHVAEALQYRQLSLGLPI